MDSNIVSKLCHPKANRNLVEWFFAFCNRQDFRLFLPEIVDYEVRRYLIEKTLRNEACKSLERLERFSNQIEYLPLTTSMWKKAAQLWAENRINGTPTAPPDSLDGDVLLAAQAIEVNGVVITENTRHIGRMVTATRWNNL